MKVNVKTTNLPVSPSVQIELEFERSELNIHNTYLGTRVRLDDWLAGDEIGGPSLPSKTLWVALPLGMIATGLQLNVIEQERVTEGPVHPEPLQPRQLDIPDIPTFPQDPYTAIHRLLPQRKKAFVSPSSDLYKRAQETPKQPARLVETRWIANIPAALIEVNPICWTANGYLELVRKLQIRLELVQVQEHQLDKAEMAATPDVLNSMQTTRILELARTMVINPDDIVEPKKLEIPSPSNVDKSVGSPKGSKVIRKERGNDCSYLIITDNCTWDSTFAVPGSTTTGDLVSSFNRLADWKKQSGLSTRVVTISEILSGRYGDFGNIPYSLMTQAGNYITVMDGGGRNCDVLHTNAFAIGPWEKFTVVALGGNQIALQTSDGHYLTAVNGGGLNREAVHTDAVSIGSWEKFTSIQLGNNLIALKTSDGHYLTAVGGGNQTTDVIHTDAVSIGPWEKFTSIKLGDNCIALKTSDGHYLTAVGSGGRNGDTLHTNAFTLGPWEQISLIPLGKDVFALRTLNGNYITAVDGGGRNRDVIHTDATVIGPWEKFTFVNLGQGQFAIRTENGHYLTAVNGGGRNADSIHTDATAIGPWERFTLVRGPYALMTDNGHYITAVDGGGKATDVIHTDATVIGPDEKFTLVSLGANQYALRTRKGFYLTALDGGDRTPSVIQTNHTSVGAWETFGFISLGGDQYAFRTATGNYLTAVNGGGRTSDVIHTDSTAVGPWEKFTLISQGGNRYALRTVDGHYLTAVNGGGQSDNAVHTDSTQIGPDEIFALITQGANLVALQTAKGNYITAVGGGGRNSDVIHTNTPVIGPWEKFTLVRQLSGQYGLQCINGKNLQAIEGGGRSADVIRTDIPYIGSWESFVLVPVNLNDLQSIIRKFVRWAHDNWGVTNVLLGGDTSIVPMRITQVNGPWGTTSMPTDFYYSSLYKRVFGINLRIPYEWSDAQSVEYYADVSVGRAPVASNTEANTFVNKVIAYEQMRSPNGTSLPPEWSRRILYAASSWGRDREGWDKQLDIFPTSSNPPGDNQCFHVGGSSRTLIRLSDILSGGQNLLVQISDSELNLIPYRIDAATAGRGWFFALDVNVTTNPLPSVDNRGNPVPTKWAVIYSTPTELDSARWFTFDPVTLEGSTNDEEILRKQVRLEIPYWDRVSRLYCDENDLSPQDIAAAEIHHISVPGLRDKLNIGQHVVSLSGHGNYNGVLWEPDPVLNSINFYLNMNLAKSLTNGYMNSIFFADACNTNSFIQQSVSKILMNNPNGGAVAYIGHMKNVVIGVGKEFQKKFFHGLAVSSTLGIAHDTRLSTFGTDMTNEEVRYHILNMSLLGDPTMHVHK